MILNCDMGENESAEFRIEIAPYLHAINIACGGHAGDDFTMTHCAMLAAEHQLFAGAHPGLAGNFGRVVVDLDVSDFLLLLERQIGRLQSHLVEQKISLHHVKLHGALYHISDQRWEIADAYITWMTQNHPTSLIVARSGGRVARLCEERKVPFWREGFLDRGYSDDGTLIPRGMPGALISSEDEILLRWKHFPLLCETLCLHADGEHALNFAKRIRLGF